MNRISGNPLLDRLGLRSPLERTAYQGTRTGFRTIALAGREFKRVRNWLPRKRLPPGAPGDLFDLSLDDDQQMIVDSLKRLARDVLRRSEEHTSELQSRPHLVCRLLLEKKKMLKLASLLMFVLRLL